MKAILPFGLALGHSGNPAASLQLERIYGLPVLLSGLPALLLSISETAALHHYYKVNTERLQRLHSSTPECVVMFLGGSLPATGILHLRMLGMLGMIARLDPSNILHRHANHTLLSGKGKSWFLTMRKLCQQYKLPDPLLVLQSPP